MQNDFEYHSGNNSQWLTVEQMRALIGEIDAEEQSEKPTLKVVRGDANAA